MRPIKFRGRSLETDDWVYGYLADGNLICTWDNFRNSHEVLSTTVGQFTGLTDKNGNEIYEGDIIRVREYENILMREFSDEPDRFDMFTLEEIRGKLLEEYVSPIVFDEGGFQVIQSDMWLASLFGDMKRSSPSFDFEIIGNVHDNPELLKGGNDDYT